MRIHRYKKIVCIILVLIFCFMSVTPAFAVVSNLIDYTHTYPDYKTFLDSYMQYYEKSYSGTKVTFDWQKNYVLRGNDMLISENYRSAYGEYPYHLFIYNDLTDSYPFKAIFTDKPLDNCGLHRSGDGLNNSTRYFIAFYPDGAEIKTTSSGGRMYCSNNLVNGKYFLFGRGTYKALSDGNAYSYDAQDVFYYRINQTGYYAKVFDPVSFSMKVSNSEYPLVFMADYDITMPDGTVIKANLESGEGPTEPEQPEQPGGEEEYPGTADLDFACGVMSLLDLLMAVLIDGGHFDTDVYMTRAESYYLCTYLYQDCSETEREYIRSLGKLSSITEIETSKVYSYLCKMLGYMQKMSFMSGKAYNSSIYDARSNGFVFARNLKFDSLPSTVSSTNNWYAWLVAGQYVLLQVTSAIPNNAVSIKSEQTRTKNDVNYYQDYVTIQDSLKYSNYYGWGAIRHFPLGSEYRKTPHYSSSETKPWYCVLSDNQYRLSVPTTFTIADRVVMKESEHVPERGRWAGDYSQTVCFKVDNELIKNAPERLSGAGGGEVVEPEVPEQPGGEVEKPVFDNKPNDDKLPVGDEEQGDTGILKSIYNKLSDIYYFLTHFLWDSIKGDSDNSGSGTSGTENDNSQGNSFFDVIGNVISGGFSLLRGLLDTILGAIKTFGLGILEAIGGLPGLIVDALSVLLVPDEEAMQALWTHFNEGFTKEFGVLNLDLSSVVGDEEVPGGIYATSVMAVDDSTDSRNKAVPLPDNVSFINFEWLIVAVEHFRPFIRAFLILMLMLFTYNQILRLLGAAPISATGGQSEVKEVSRKG